MIPELKSTNEALAYGADIRENPAAILELEAERRTAQESFDRVMRYVDVSIANGKRDTALVNLASRLATRTQLLREALEEAGTAAFVKREPRKSRAACIADAISYLLMKNPHRFEYRFNMIVDVKTGEEFPASKSTTGWWGAPRTWRFVHA